MSLGRAVLTSVEHVLLPPQCVLCGGAGSAPGVDLCAGCRLDLPRNVPACQRCAEPLGTMLVRSPWCGHCIARPPPWDAAFCAFRYGFPVDHLLTGLKFRRQLAHGRVLGLCLLEELVPWLARRGREPLPQALVPVPLHWRREWHRGFNQACEIARPLAAALRLPLRRDVVKRVAATSEQSGLRGAARRQNVSEAFAAKRGHGLSHVAIVDDVVTTGSTVEALTRELRASGVARVEVWSCARAARSHHG
ncbi:MAG: ComF family protein [Pseudomonadota bacterium]